MSEAVAGSHARVGGALIRYRVMAWIVSVLLIVLVVIGVPLKYAGHHPGIAKWVGIAHGMFFYPLFLIVAIDLAWRTRMHPVRMLLTLVAGTVPFVSFVAERETTKWVQSR